MSALLDEVETMLPTAMIGSVVRKVATNRAVVVPNLKVGKGVKSVRVSVV